MRPGATGCDRVRPEKKTDWNGAMEVCLGGSVFRWQLCELGGSSRHSSDALVSGDGPHFMTPQRRGGREYHRSGYFAATLIGRVQYSDVLKLSLYMGEPPPKKRYTWANRFINMCTLTGLVLQTDIAGY